MANAFHLPDLGGATPWSGLDKLPDSDREFRFALLSDRTGEARPGVFERAIEVTNLLRPDFVIQVGDLIEGYTRDPAELERQWSEIDTILGQLEAPLFRVSGNHDASNPLMRSEWDRRHGAGYYHFRYRDVLFLVLDTQDPPQTMADFIDLSRPFGERTVGDVIGDRRRLQRTDPAAAVAIVEAMTDWDGKMPANFSEAQLNWAEGVLAKHADARWTFVCLHMPIWQGNHPAFDRLHTALGDRPHTWFSGHVHNYRRTVLDGHDHIRLGPTGGLWVISGDEGNFDHVTMVTMTADGPRLANIVLDGVLDAAGGVFAPPPRLAATMPGE